MKLPIYKAKKKNSEEYSKGYIFKGWRSLNTWTSCVMFTESGNNVEIEAETISISFDDGATWYDDFENINQILIGNY